MKEDTWFSKKILIDRRLVGNGQPVFIVAEAGVAHFGKVEKALSLVDLAVEAGADAVKFQIFRTDSLISTEAMDWKARLSTRELPYEAFPDIKRYCAKRNIIFFATAHDEDSLVFLDKLEPPLYKIGSGEVKNWAFIKRIAQKGKPVIVSTGMYTLKDVQRVVNLFKEANNPSLMLLHCVTSYPTRPGNVNLATIPAMSKGFGAITGYSDHTEGIHFPLAAVALGAKIIEKHIALDFNVPNAQDWKVSCGLHSLSEMVMQIRDIEKGLGDGQKKVALSEEKSILWARKSIVAVRSIATGETITEQVLAYKRPGSGIAPNELDNVVGKKAKKPIGADTLIQWCSLE